MSDISPRFDRLLAGPMHSGVPGAYALALSGSDGTITLPVGVYRCWLKERLGTTSVFLKVGGAATIPADATVDAGVFGFAGDETVLVQVGAGESVLHAICTTGTPTLYLVRVR